MSTYHNNCNSDFRNEGWGLQGSSVDHCWQAWSAIGDDTKYCYNPGNKGRACVRFPVDISSGDIADGSAIESVTVFIRAKKTVAGSISVSVNMLCSDDTSHSTQRTVYLTTDITTQEIGTYTHDPLGKPWTKDRLNRLMVQVFSYCGQAGAVRVYECYAVVNYRNRPVVTVTAPSGSVNSASPTVSWTYTQVDGDPQKLAEYRIFSAAQQALATFDPDFTPPLYPPSRTYTVKTGDSLWAIAARFLGDGSLWPQIYQASVLRSGDPNLIYPGEVVTIPGGGGNSGTGGGSTTANPGQDSGNGIVQGDVTTLPALPFSLAQDDYYIYVRATSTHGARSDWANRAFTVTGSAPGVPGGATGVGTGGGGGFESVIADSITSNVFLSLRDGSNMLAVQQADFETLTDSLGWIGTNCTLARDTTTSYGVGAGSMSVEATAAGTVTFESDFMEVTGGAPLTVRGQIKAATDVRTCQIWVDYYDVGFSLVGSSTSVSVTDSASTWTELLGTGTTTNDTGYAKVKFEIDSAAANEVHNVDHIGLMYGTGSAWSNGGHMSRNLLTSAASDADDPIDTEPWTANTGGAYSRVATTGTGSEGTKAFKMLYQGLTPTISVVATGTAFTDTTTGPGVTLNKPAGVVDADVLVAYVGSDTDGSVTIPPTGWSVLNTAVAGTGSTRSGLTVLIKDGKTADPSSWTFNLDASATRKRAVVVAYRGAAAVADQLSQENSAGSTSGSLTPTTPAINNTDPNAWRLSAFLVRDDTSSGSMTANISPPSAPAGIAYVGRAGVWKDQGGANTSFTINRPSGVQTGDLMIASLAVSGNVTVTAPSGWTTVRTVHDTVNGGDEHSGSITFWIGKRTAGSSESASWSGSHSSTGKPKISECVAYRNCADAASQFIDEGGSSDPSSYSGNLTTDVVTNTDSKAWRVCMFAGCTDVSSFTTSNEVAQRTDDSTSLSGYPDVSIGAFDSNGTVSTGHHSRTGNFYADTFSGASWIGLLKPLATAPTPGANETERSDGTTGSSNPWMTLAAYDSNGVAGTGNTTVYGSFAPGSGASVLSSCAWLGFLVPAAQTVGGEVGCTLADYIDISAVSTEVLTRAGNQMTVQAAFLGSTAGVPHLKMYAYVGNELISTQVAEGASFNTDTWTKAVSQFVLPTGTTRIKLGVAAQDRLVDDYVLYDRVSVAFGSDTVWRRGTGNTSHPVFNIPVIEFAEDLGDGYGDWAELPGTSKALLKYDNSTGLCTFVDQGVVPLSHRKYRAKTVSYGLNGEVFISDYGPVSDEITLVAENWWLKDMAVPDNSMKLKLFNNGNGGPSGGAGTISVTTSDTSAVFQPLGADRPLVITEGYKGDVLQLVIQVRSTDYARLRDLLNARRTLYLQSNIDQAWWVRPSGDLNSTLQPTGDMHTNPLKFVTVSFVEVDPEA